MKAYSNQTRELRAKLLAYIEREHLFSVMNRTKWDEAIAALQELPDYDLIVRIKVLTNEPGCWQSWEGFRPAVLLVSSIEWMEIHPLQIPPKKPSDGRKVDYTRQIVHKLRSLSIPYTLEPHRWEERTDHNPTIYHEMTVIRIWGYARPEDNLQFAETTSDTE